MYTQKHYENFMENVFDSQKKIFDMWKNAVAPSVTEKEISKDPNFIDSSLEMMNKWNEVNSKFFENMMGFSKENPVYSTYDKVFSNINSYGTLFNMWKDFQDKTMGTNPFDMNSFMDSWKKEYLDMVGTTFSPVLPQKVQKLYRDSIDIYKSHMANANNFFKPWTDSSAPLNELYTKTLMGDANSFVEFTRLWKENYERSFGKFFDMPTLGLNRNYFEVNLKSMESYINYINTTNEFTSTLYKVAYETMENIVSESLNIIKENKEPQSFREFYEYWWRKNEEAYNNLFNTDDFAKLLAHVVDSGATFKKDFDNLLEQQFSFLPFPLKSDLNSLYKTVYDLKKQVRELSKKID
ncbi:MAG: hypothetical protein N4A57_03690 [Anaeromicrobium sp.]|jgi:class III poly(R)-hydroxyalkanoic acid synthase PhaE subunit|uniref:poly(R)-hydroxyalkanoic acid synthase subunit PhaE n=1 Tax=Anaeromicrobium sp. TaxID=1929132 RepID=UPI0025ECA6FD|nr:poly(R)-hydroxyalkanoic acid synthase subunit PhaE [Anaeromicrobium sp.]MCT4593361.1 hypothetical protein [Anaeromicrobium sp.]